MPAGKNVTMNFDTHITKVTLQEYDGEWTSSGQTVNIYAATDGIYCTATLESGYVLYTVESSAGESTILSDNRFAVTALTSTSAIVTLTSKASGGETDMNTINLTTPNGINIKTGGKYVADDIKVIPTLEEKSVTPTTSAQTVEPSTGNCGLKKVTVGAIQTEAKTQAASTSNVTVTPTTGKYLASVIVTPTPNEAKTVTPTSSSQSVTPTTGKLLSKVTVNAVPTETKSVTPTRSAQTVTPSSGKFLASVSVGAIQTETMTITPAKGSQTVQPTSGKYFSAVTVEAIPSDYIIPSGTQQITANGTYDVSGKASAVVNVPSGVEEVATASAMNALLVEENVGKYYKFTGTTDDNFVNGDLYLVESGT